MDCSAFCESPADEKKLEMNFKEVFPEFRKPQRASSEVNKKLENSFDFCLEDEPLAQKVSAEGIFDQKRRMANKTFRWQVEQEEKNEESLSDLPETKTKENSYHLTSQKDRGLVEGVAAPSHSHLAPEKSKGKPKDQNRVLESIKEVSCQSDSSSGTLVHNANRLKAPMLAFSSNILKSQGSSNLVALQLPDKKNSCFDSFRPSESGIDFNSNEQASSHSNSNFPKSLLAAPSETSQIKLPSIIL